MRNLLFLLLITVSASCVNYQKLIYMKEPTTTGSHGTYQTQDYRIRPYDILSVQVNSLEQNTSPYINEEFNQGGGGGRMSGQMNNAVFYVNGYVVNKDGMIQLPLIGEIKVGGMTTQQIKKLVDERLAEYLKFTSVSVKLVNFRVTVLGEVKTPGVQYIYEEKFTLFQALSQASDLTEFGNRNRVKLIREFEGGTKTVYLNLEDPDILTSEYYFLMPNDIIYIEPIQAKAFAVNSRALTLSISAISVILVIINIILTR